VTGFADILKTIETLRKRENEFQYSDVTLADEQVWAIFRQLEKCEPPIWNRSASTVEEAHVLLPQEINNYFELESPDYALLVKALPGTGKTTAAAGIAEKLALSGKRVGYAGPRHDFFEQVLEKAEHPRLWYEWLPRQEADPDLRKPETCKYAHQITQWMNRGYEGMDFCSKVCGWDYVSNWCPYHAQRNVKEPIIFIQHQHISLGHPLAFNAIIGDENPTASFLNEWRIPGRFIMPSGMNQEEPITSLLYYMQTIADNSTHMEGEELIDYLGGPDEVIKSCEDYRIALSAQALSPTIYNADEVDNMPYFHLPALASLLVREAESYKKKVDYPHRILLHGGSLNLLLRRPVSNELPAHMCWLDATGNNRIYQSILQREIKSVDIQPHINGKIYQIVDRSNNKSTIMKGEERTPKADQLEKTIDHIIKKYGYKNPVIISYQAFVKNVKIEAKTAHFYAARGSNAYQDCDAIIVAGTPQPSIYDVAKMAKMIFFERDTGFDFGKFTAMPLKYRFVDADGFGRQYPISGFWNDQDLQEILKTVREDEIVQAAHRGRPVNRDVDIWLLLNMPIDSLPPDELLTIRDIFDAPLGVNAFLFHNVLELANSIADRNGGIITLNDFIESGINRRTAMRYMDALTEDNGWVDAKIRKNASGRPQRAISRGV
jgi:hypothetical protein